MKLAYIIPMSRAIRDSDTGKWSFIDVFNAVVISKQLDYVVQNFYATAVLRSTTIRGSHTASIKLFDPDEKEIATADFEGILEREETNYTGYFPIVRFEKTGRHTFHFFFDGKPVKDNGQYYIDVTKEV